MLLSLLSKRSWEVDARDAYGFTVRPQHLQRFREYAHIYKEEEEERLLKWNRFLEQQADSVQTPPSAEVSLRNEESEVIEQQSQPVEVLNERDASCGGESGTGIHKETDVEKVVAAPILRAKSRREVQKWVPTKQSLNHIESMLSYRVQNRKDMRDEQRNDGHNHLPSIEEVRLSGEDFEQACEEVCDNAMDSSHHDPKEPSVSGDDELAETMSPSKQELEFLVQGGVPRDLRGEVWQAFVGVRTRRIEKYYQDLLDPESVSGDDEEPDRSESGEDRKGQSKSVVSVPEKLRKQIEKDLTRTFPGHPALDENGRDSLRRLLLAYARHNPSVGYCQAMNFFAGLLLLMMPEENAFWTLVGIIDDYFEGYYSQEMIESQVDQLVFEDLVREKFPKLVNHLDYLGVQVTWLSGPWFLSIYVNMLPWESVLRVWDVLLFEGNRVMLFRTALALLELYGPALATTNDAPDAISLLQSLAGSTFDSSQLVLTACMGFLNVTEERLQGLREKHRPSVVTVVEERSKGVPAWKDPKGLATKLYSFKHNTEEPRTEEVSGEKGINGDVSSSTNLDKMLPGLDIDAELDALPDLQEQVVWLKAELCRSLEEKRTAVLRAEELETALMEIVKQDNRRELSARVEQLEQEVAELRQAHSDKTEQESAMIQVLMRVEQEQKLTEDGRIFAQQDAAAQRYAMQVLQEKYDQAMASIAQMEKRVVMAESMLEATMQYESGQVKALASPGPLHLESPRDIPRKTGLLSFSLGWRDRNKGKQNDNAGKSTKELAETSSWKKTNGHQE